MAWSSPKSWVTGYKVLASDLNTFLSNNDAALRAGGIAVASQAAGDVVYASSGTQLARLAKDEGKFLKSGASAVSWAAAQEGLEQSHRGLVVGTSPNQDVEATTVVMTKCDGLVTNSGQYVEPTAGASAIITGSGAGGLDTGAETAARYYEVHFICNADASSQNLLLHLGRTAYVDTAQTTSTSNVLSILYSTGKAAQSIQVARAGKLTHVDMRMNRLGTIATSFWMTIEADSSGAPSGTPLATSDKFHAADITTTTQDVRFNFRTPLTVATSTTYWMVLQGDWTADTVNFIRLYGNAAGGYANGTASWSNADASVWTDVTGDLYFRPFVTVESAALTMPSGYTEACFLGYVFNDGSSNFRPVEQVGKSVRMTGTATSTGAVTATQIPMIFEFYGSLPPAHCIGHLSLGTDASDGDVYSEMHVGSVGNPHGMVVYQPLSLATFGGAASTRSERTITCNTNDTWAFYYSPGGRNGSLSVYGYELI